VPADGGPCATRTIAGPGDRSAAAAAWAAVEARVAGDVPLMVSWDWTSAWLEHWGEVVAHRLVVVEDDRGPCGVALLCRATRRRGGVPVRRLHVGTSGEPVGEGVAVEHNRVLCAPERRAAVHAALAEVVVADRGWDELAIDGASEPDVAIAVARRVWRGTLRVDTLMAPHHDLRLAAPGDDLASVLASGPRRRLRQSLRAFAARGEIALDRPRDADAALAILDELVGLHQARWTAAGEAGAFASPRFVAFHRELVARLVPEGRAAVVRVRCGEETVGCLYGLVDGDALRFYQSGLATFDDNRLRAGLVTHAVFMEACRRDGLALYDFLAGDARYKDELATGSTPLRWAVARRPRLRLRALDVAVGLRDRRRRRTEARAAGATAPAG
jgi:CelD/BcsL family acetyltransferase involved in cellulose biosynthesis